MTNIVEFGNNDSTTLAASITTSQTTITVVSGSGAEFPPATFGSFFPITLISATNSSIYEICYCTGRSGDTFTVTRAREGTTATAFNAGDTVANLLTAGVMALLPQLGTSNTWSGSNTFSATGTFSSGVISNGLDSGAAQFRAVNGNYGLMIQNNGVTGYMLLTNSGSPYGSYNALRPLQITLSTGAVTLDATGAGGTTVGGNLQVTLNSNLSGNVEVGGQFYASQTGTIGTNLLVNGSSNLVGGAITTGPTNPSDSSTAIPNTAFVQSAIINAGRGGIAAYTSAGSISHTVAAGVYFIEATVVGGGGAGAGCIPSGGNYISGGGGGGGGTAISILAVTPGQVISGTVGQGGAVVNAAVGGAGGTSSFGALSASGGGGANYTAPTNCPGGGGGQGFGGQLNLIGSAGSDSQSGTFIFPGNGGSSFLGGGTRAANFTPNNASGIGAGGGGVYGSTAGTYVGASGGTGAIIVKWLS